MCLQERLPGQASEDPRAGASEWKPLNLSLFYMGCKPSWVLASQIVRKLSYASHQVTDIWKKGIVMAGPGSCIMLFVRKLSRVSFECCSHKELSLGPALAKTQPPPAPEPKGSWPASGFWKYRGLLRGYVLGPVSQQGFQQMRSLICFRFLASCFNKRFCYSL